MPTINMGTGDLVLLRQRVLFHISESKEFLIAVHEIEISPDIVFQMLR